ncbi:MAG: class I SAM-dependent methyltransferase, partial [Planctomycetota bacterium]
MRLAVRGLALGLALGLLAGCASKLSRYDRSPASAAPSPPVSRHQGQAGRPRKSRTVTVDTPPVDHAAVSREILSTTGVKGGLVVHVGCGDGRLTVALRASDSYLVHGLDPDAADVAAARRHVASKGLCGPVSVERLSGPRLPYADNLVNLVVAEDLAGVPTDEVMRVLAPGGVAWVKGAKTAKPRPDEIDEWTHFLHDASNNAVSRDTVVGPPKSLQWASGPRWARSHDHLSSLSACVSARGRIFHIVDEGPVASVALPPKWKLVARDAFNGTLLWKRPIKSWEGHLRNFRSGPADLARRLVAERETVYVTLGYGEPVVALDAATGKTLREYPQTANSLEIILCDEVLYVVGGDRTPDNADNATVPQKPAAVWHWWPIYEEKAPRKRIVAADAGSGAVLW